MSRTLRNLCTNALAASLFIIGACSVERTPRAVRGGTLVIAAPTDLDFTNTLVSADRYTQELLRYALFVPLVQYDEDLNFVPALASSWEMLGDTGVVFHLRNDVRWQDGRRTTAHDAAFTITRAMDPNTGYPNAEYLTGWNPAVTVVDSFTLRVSFTAQPEPLAGLPFMPIMPQHLLDSIPAARMRQAAFNRKPVGNGPYRFVSQRANDQWVFEANPDFPEGLGGRPHIDRVVWRVIPETTGQITELQAGGVQVVLAPRAPQFNELRDQNGIRGITRASRQYAFVGWNGKRPPFQDARVRQALTMAIDRKRILDALRGGYGDIGVGPVAPFHWAYDTSLQPLPFNPDSARKLLAAAGFADANADGVLDGPNGPFKFELKIPASNDFNRDVAEMIRAQLADVGVQAVTRQVEWGTLVGDATSPERRFDAVLMAWESDFKLNMRDLFHSAALKGPYQFASFADTRVDSLLDLTSRTVDRDQARPMWRRFQELMRDAQPWTFLFYYPDLFLVSNRLQDVQMDIRGVFVNLPEWWFAPGRSD